MAIPGLNAIPASKSIREYADDMWNSIKNPPPTDNKKLLSFRYEEYEPGLVFILAFANSLVVETKDGLVMFDVGNHQNQKLMQTTVRKFSQKPLHTAVYTHGHIDHVFGVANYEKESGAPKAVVIGHKNLPKRFDRYNLTNGYNAHINARQFRTKPEWPRDFRWPDITYEESLTTNVGGVVFELYHAKGETDDATWAYIPKYKALATGDLFIWSVPNCGNPQKVQRYAKEWAQALRIMQGKKARYLFPGHGPPIEGEARVEQALSETAEYLESIISQTLEKMNQGLRLDEIIHSVKPPKHLLSRPYLSPNYDDPEFLVRNIWRLYGGWWDFEFDTLKPAPTSLLSKEIAQLAGGVRKLAERADKLSQSTNDNDMRLACHLIEYAAKAVDGDSEKKDSDDRKEVHRIRAEIYQRRNKKEISYMATGVYRDAILRSQDVTKPKLQSKL